MNKDKQYYAEYEGGVDKGTLVCHELHYYRNKLKENALSVKDFDKCIELAIQNGRKMGWVAIYDKTFELTTLNLEELWQEIKKNIIKRDQRIVDILEDE